MNGIMKWFFILILTPQLQGAPGTVLWFDKPATSSSARLAPAETPVLSAADLRGLAGDPNGP